MPGVLRATFATAVRAARSTSPDAVGEFPGFEPYPLIRLDDRISGRIVEAVVHWDGPDGRVGSACDGDRRWDRSHRLPARRSARARQLAQVGPSISPTISVGYGPQPVETTTRTPSASHPLGSDGSPVVIESRAGTALGQCRDTGSSVAPHLHFHIADGPSAVGANGIPFVLRHVPVGQPGLETQTISTPTRQPRRQCTHPASRGDGRVDLGEQGRRLKSVCDPPPFAQLGESARCVAQGERAAPAAGQAERHRPHPSAGREERWSAPPDPASPA